MLNVDGWTDGRTNVRTDGNLHVYVFLLKQVRQKLSLSYPQYPLLSASLCFEDHFYFSLPLFLGSTLTGKICAPHPIPLLSLFHPPPPTSFFFFFEVFMIQGSKHEVTNVAVTLWWCIPTV